MCLETWWRARRRARQALASGLEPGLETGRVLGRQETGSGRNRVLDIGVWNWNLEICWISGLIGKEGWWAFCDWALVWVVCVVV